MQVYQIYENTKPEARSFSRIIIFNSLVTGVVIVSERDS